MNLVVFSIFSDSLNKFSHRSKYFKAFIFSLIFFKIHKYKRINIVLYIITSSVFCVLVRNNDINRITLSRVGKLQNPQNMRQDIMVRVLRSVLVRGSAKRTKRLHSTNLFERNVVHLTNILG